MQRLIFTRTNSLQIRQSAHVGVVSSGDLEILITPSGDLQSHVTVETSVEGYDHTWETLLDRFFSKYPVAVNVTVHDFGATPGVVLLRLEQALELSQESAIHTTYASAIHPPGNCNIARNSFIELKARQRAQSLLDREGQREIIGPHDRLESPWLPQQGIVPQSDDGCVVMKGTINHVPAVVVAIESAFLGGSIGEVSGMKLATALQLALKDNEDGVRTQAVLLLESGGVRLQEANLGELVVAEIYSAIVALRRHVPVVGVIAGMVGCFGGLSLAAGLCSYLIVTRQGRLGMNGPEVIEQEAGIDEFDASDRALIWSIDGGEQRYAIGMADALAGDDVDEIAALVKDFSRRDLPQQHRSQQVDFFSRRIDALDIERLTDTTTLRHAWNTGEAR